MRLFLTISIAILIAFLPLTFFMNNLFFTYEFNKQDIAASSGFDINEYLFYNSQVLKYFFNNSSTISVVDRSGKELTNFFTGEEIIHLHDVKVIIDVATLLVLLAALFLTLFARKLKNIVSPAKTASVIVMLAYGVILTFVIFDFDKAFYKFHEILFTNSFWLLPETDMLIRMYPENLFYDCAKFWFATSFIISVIILSIRKRT